MLREGGAGEIRHAWLSGPELEVIGKEREVVASRRERRRVLALFGAKVFIRLRESVWTAGVCMTRILESLTVAVIVAGLWMAR